MDNNVYESTLDLNIDPFLTAIKEAKAVWEDLANYLNTPGGTKWYDETTQKMKEASNELEALKIQYNELYKLTLQAPPSSASKAYKDEFNAFADALLLTKKRLETVQTALAETKTEAENTASSVQTISEATVDAEKKSSKLPSIFKKMAFAVMGVRSAFTFFRKVVGTALANNVELSNKFQAIWTALGNAITPILERIANFILTIFSYLNILVKTLSGGKIDLLAKTSKSAKSTAKSVKEANKFLAGFDELQNVEDNAGGGSGDKRGIRAMATDGMEVVEVAVE